MTTIAIGDYVSLKSDKNVAGTVIRMTEDTVTFQTAGIMISSYR